METPADDLAARGRSIFEQLRVVDERERTAPVSVAPEVPTGPSAADPTAVGEVRAADDKESASTGGSALAPGVDGGLGRNDAGTGEAGGFARPTNDQGPPVGAGDDGGPVAHGEPASGAGDGGEPARGEQLESEAEGGRKGDGGSTGAESDDRRRDHADSEAVRSGREREMPNGPTSDGGTGDDPPPKAGTAETGDDSDGPAPPAPPVAESDAAAGGRVSGRAHLDEQAGQNPLDAATTIRAAARAGAEAAELGGGVAGAEEAQMEGGKGSGPLIEEQEPVENPRAPSAGRSPVLDRPLFHVEPTAPSPAAAPVPTAASDPSPPPRPHRPLPRVMAVANQKGGVGKTTTAVNLGAALAELGYRTLVVDLDPQGNATTGLGINARVLETSVYDVLMRELPIEDALEPTSVRNLFVVPATIDLAGAEIELVPAFSRELRLKRALDGVADDFDFTLIDCPPSLGLLTVNALAAAGEVVVPVQCEYYALEGLSALLRNVQLVQNNLNKALEVSTIVLTMYDARTKLAEQVAQEVRSHFGNVVCRNLVPRTVRLSEAPSYGQPIIVFDPTSRGAIAYRELAKEVSGGSPKRIG